jgi:hypothetical protein
MESVPLKMQILSVKSIPAKKLVKILEGQDEAQATVSSALFLDALKGSLK